MQVAITGSSGLVGSALVQALLDNGDTPIRVTRNKTGDVFWDPVAGVLDGASLEGVDVVVHLAGAGIGDKRWSDKRKAILLDSRVDGTRLLSSTLASLDRPPSKLLSASAIGYYGDQSDRPLTESDPQGQGFMAEVCSAWEASTEAAERAGISVTHLRTGIVLSPVGGMLKRLLPIYRLALGGPLGKGDQMMSWISLHDEVAAIMWLFDHDLTGPVNLTSPEAVTSRRFAKALGRAVNRPAFIPVPAIMPMAVFGRELVEGLIVASANVHPERLVASGFPYTHPELESALQEMVGA